jgi:septal ring factor EnvC (AmiA/AmiB activator)
MNLLSKEKEIASKQIVNQNMELEKLRKQHDQQIQRYDEVKADLDRVSKEVSQAVLDKERAESAKRSSEVIGCDMAK